MKKDKEDRLSQLSFDTPACQDITEKKWQERN
jgi:hypothetical protein